eukprot:7814190-Alexandrium_andersonii.AAC.1
MKSHPEFYQPSWDGKAPTKEEAVLESFDEYLVQLNCPGAWGSELEVAAAALQFDVPIVLVVGEGALASQGKPNHYVHHRAGKNKAIVLHFKGRHYDYMTGTLPSDV